MSPHVSLFVAGALIASASGAPPAPPAATTKSQPAASTVLVSPKEMRTATASDEAKLKTLSDRYRTSKAVTVKVAKSLKLGLLGEERKSSGTMALSGGQLRLELDGAEKTLLIVNKKNVWSVTYPPAEFKDAAIQIIKADTSSTKAKSQALTGLLGAGGFSKSFKATAVQITEQGELAYFLQPARTQADFKRARLVVSKDGKSIVELKYWDERDNETTFAFSETTFAKKIDPKKFEFSPPANADVMTL